MDGSMNTKTIGPQWLVIEGLKIALILLVGFALARVGAELQTALPLYHPVVLGLWTDIARFATFLTAVLYTVTRATLRANAIADE